VYLQGLKICQTVHGELHTDVAATLNNLRVLHRVYGQYAQAEPLLTQALVIKEKLLGLDRPDVALSVVNLGQLRVVQKGSRRKRNRCTVEPWRFESRRWGVPPEFAKTLEDLANALRKVGRADEAILLELHAKTFRAKRS
jgi:tetratricopeptide (TPR) repeat protein